jgi:hypothetical protein
VEIFDLREARQQRGQAIGKTEIFAVVRCVLADETDFADARGGQVFGFPHDGFEPSAAEFAAKLWNDAEGTAMIATFVDFDVGGVSGCGENAGGKIVIQIGGRRCRRDHPRV